MNTPFDDLRMPIEPIAPDARFAARLRAQVTQALTTDLRLVDLPARRPTTTTTGSNPVATPTVSNATLVPYIAVGDGVAALDWYARVFGAVEHVRYVADDGRIGHAEISIGGAPLWLSDAYPELDVHEPGALGGTPVSLHLDVADVDEVFAAAVGAGAAVQRQPADQPYGERSCSFVDPFGHRWTVGTTVAHPTAPQIEAQMEGFTIVESAAGPAVPPVEVGYLTIGTADTGRAVRFYGALFGWTAERGHGGDAYAHVHNTKLPLGFTPDGVDSAPVLYFRVDDLARYTARVRELGGAVIDESVYESGPNATCRDDQGGQFRLWQPAPGY
jgi:uncharacterized glyoxalase superfamily protein PhnB